MYLISSLTSRMGLACIFSRPPKPKQILCPGGVLDPGPKYLRFCVLEGQTKKKYFLCLSQPILHQWCRSLPLPSTSTFHPSPPPPFHPLHDTLSSLPDCPKHATGFLQLSQPFNLMRLIFFAELSINSYILLLTRFWSTIPKETHGTSQSPTKDPNILPTIPKSCPRASQ